jgi:hypothetical protein
MTKAKKLTCLILLLGVFAVTVSIDLFHTEKIGSSDSSCPACRFHNSSLVVLQTNCFDLPSFAFLGNLDSFVPAEHKVYSSSSVIARSPPTPHFL